MKIKRVLEDVFIDSNKIFASVVCPFCGRELLMKYETYEKGMHVCRCGAVSKEGVSVKLAL